MLERNMLFCVVVSALFSLALQTLSPRLRPAYVSPLNFARLEPKREEHFLNNEINSSPTEWEPVEKKYCESRRFYRRFPSRTVYVGGVPIGSEHRIKCQTMTTSDTRDVDATVEQIIRSAKAGADLVRITVQGVKEAEACKKIKATLLQKGYEVPIVADVHFNPKIALLAADSCDKIRVNPGNFADGLKKWDDKVFDNDDDDEFVKGRSKIETLFGPVVEKCKQLDRAIRIGTNHGSLSSRILAFYGDTPKGMVESAFEFAEICRSMHFHNFVFSMKASNPIVMVQAYRLLALEMYKKGWDYPIHLGVTEAGEGEDGRIKSAIGIGSLLQDGLGDTIRVSLTEDPWFELGPCRTFADMAERKAYETAQQERVPAFDDSFRDIKSFFRREVDLPKQVETDDWDVRGVLHRDGSVFVPINNKDLKNPQQLYDDLRCQTVVGVPLKAQGTVDSVYVSEIPEDPEALHVLKSLQKANIGIIVDTELLKTNNSLKNLQNKIALFKLNEFLETKDSIEKVMKEIGAIRYGVVLTGLETDSDLRYLASLPAAVPLSPTFFLLNPDKSLAALYASRRIFSFFNSQSRFPIVHYADSLLDDLDAEEASLKTGMETGALMVDALGEGIMVGGNTLSVAERVSIGFNILQGARMRNTKTEFISCPSCGRTLFNLQETTDQIRKRTGHLPGVAIAVMGCIVNGVGEMADADFGYVGGSPGKVDLYVGKKVVERGIPNSQACDRLIDLIKAHGKWVDPPETTEAQS